MRRAQIRLGDELGQEPAHRSRRQEVPSAFGRAEPRQVNGEQAGVLGGVSQIDANAYRLSGQGLVSRTTGSCEPPLSA